MESNKSKENRKGNNRRRGGRKEEKLRRIKHLKSEETVSLWPPLPIADVFNTAEQETSLDLENFDKGSEKFKPSLMCPALRRQLQTHKNVLRLLHEHKLASTQINGQRILSIQPIRWSGPTPGIDCEIFVGRIPKTIYEDTLYPLFKRVGEVFQIRLMVDMAELTRGYCFIMYTNPDDAARAITQLDQYEISPGRKIRVLASVNKCKLYVGPLPWHIASEEVVIYASAWDIEYVSIYRFPNHDAAYAIVSFKSHRNAALARRKLRPERLFKCNEVHVEWARVDWNPTNVYEDRGTVDDKGDVQITRKYLQSKKTTTSTPAPSTESNDSKGSCKQISPICPPQSPNGDNGPANSPITKSFGRRNRNVSRYSTMLAMSAMDEASLGDENKKPPQMVLTDINDNVQSLDEHYYFQDKTLLKKDADGFPNFDMWNSNTVSTLPHLPTDSSRSYEPLNKLSKKSLRENAAEYPPPQASLFNGYPNDSGARTIASYNSNCNFLANKTIDQTRSIAAVRHQNYPACYVLVPYFYSKDAIACPQSSLTHQDRRLYGCNEQIDVSYLNSLQIGEKLSDHEVWHGGVLTKVGKGDAILRTANPFATTSRYVQNCTPNRVLNCTPTENATSCLIPFDVASDNEDKRPRPILKQETTRVE
ncbi:uncharacterized protein LOC105203247 isoform X2 [Solenopsis invicta]|uniref:uncharacterized protein LOC105203247 isoform X2 n=1 Tax=Solenopsis invicta TaxID=13686 RepID=UPI000E340435|nr:uncharacterized protein LOC105203247 isoform X2 [Solenopsis invicta]